MHRANSPRTTKTIRKPHNLNKVPGTNSIVIKKWINVLSSDKRFTADLPKDKTKGNAKNSEMLTLLNKIDLRTDSLKDKTEQTKTQVLSNTIDLRTASQTVDNSMDTEADLLLGINQLIKTPLPDFNQFKSILGEDSDKDLLPGIYQITQPNFNEFIGEHEDYTWPSQDEDALPSIHCMLPPGCIEQ